MKCEIVTGNMPQLWEDLLSQLHEKEYPSESIRHYREAMGRVDRYMRENQILEYTEAVGETYDDFVCRGSCFQVCEYG